MAQGGDIRVGISGWRYAGWRNVFYPAGLPQRCELEFASRRFDSIELNGSFYSLKSAELYAKWRDETPPGFVFAVKGGRYITHMRRLRDVDRALANFFASGVLELRQKLGPFLWQFPASLPYDERFEHFLNLLPRTQNEAVRLGSLHDERIARFVPPSTGDHELRHVVEVRSPTFMTVAFVQLLRRYGVGLVVADTASRFPIFEDVTAPFVYVRLHGDVKLYESGYSAAALDRWAERIRIWSMGREPSDAQRIGVPAKGQRPRDIYVYFDNDMKVKAPFDALALAARLAGER